MFPICIYTTTTTTKKKNTIMVGGKSVTKSYITTVYHLSKTDRYTIVYRLNIAKHLTLYVE